MPSIRPQAINGALAISELLPTVPARNTAGGVGVKVLVGVCVYVGVGVMLGVSVGVALGSMVDVAVRVGRRVRVAVVVVVAVCVAARVEVDVGCVPSGVAVGDRVG